MRRGGFTLIEVLAVIALMGLIAGATVWSLAEEARGASRETIVERIVNADRMARLAAQRLGEPYELRFDLDQQRVGRVVAGSEARASHVLRLPGAHRLDRVVVGPASASPAPGSGGPMMRETGVVSVVFATGGRSATYALWLTDEHAKQVTRLVISGLTGQITRVNDDNEIDNLFAILSAGRADAD